MNKSIKIVIGALITIIAIWGIIFCINCGEALHFKIPIFVVQDSPQNKGEGDSNIHGSNKFRAIVLSCNEKTLMVRPLEEKDIKILSDKVSIELGNNNDMIYIEGQELLITYIGDVMDTYPTQIRTTKIQTEID